MSDSDEIAWQQWSGRGAELLAMLADPDPQVRSTAAIRVAELAGRAEVGLPDTATLFDILRQRDCEHPGVADAFWETLRWNGLLDDTFDHAALKAWMISVLLARVDRRELSPVPGNDLEFHAHELFEGDYAALQRLLGAGYDELVATALDHNVLPDEQTIHLLRALYERTNAPNYARWLAVDHGILVDPARTRWPAVSLLGARAVLISEDYAYRRLWTVHVLLFDPPAVDLTKQPAALLEALRNAGVELEPEEETLDPSAVKHIGCPRVAGAQRVVHHPRQDLQLDLVVAADGAVLALRVVRARTPLR